MGKTRKIKPLKEISNFSAKYSRNFRFKCNKRKLITFTRSLLL